LGFCSFIKFFFTATSRTLIRVFLINFFFAATSKKLDNWGFVSIDFFYTAMSRTLTIGVWFSDPISSLQQQAEHRWTI
jgi:hypothetical protein